MDRRVKPGDDSLWVATAGLDLDPTGVLLIAES
jgi:hypothetical protein